MRTLQTVLQRLEQVQDLKDQAEKRYDSYNGNNPNKFIATLSILSSELLNLKAEVERLRKPRDQESQKEPDPE